MSVDAVVVAVVGVVLAVVLGLALAPLRRRVRAGRGGRRGLLALVAGNGAVVCAALALLSLLYVDPGAGALVLGGAALALLLVAYAVAPRPVAQPGAD